ncbi:[protein-PII] uridylyltransferase [Halovulum dunhuangense]|uniref:Bifunctional uridylyltransferase/uridylyl-removing enzyme n=1 Tax=Halovulum dunhuangense TaxID=1505036 RepID=A0A849KPC4_9RHOB|nr:[protein-PII] uridylyltransferase [Halovulum dunhuangense]NNU78893.1 [protein-PII] uridylyltransferase [Halovulum dunhuangense]
MGPDTLPTTTGLDPEDGIDEATLLARIETIARTDAPIETRRADLVKLLRETNHTGRERIAEALSGHPYAARQATRAYTRLTDALVRGAWAFVTRAMHPNPNPTAGEQLAVLAVGGYGRAEMAPFSDVDLLFLTPWKQTAWGESTIESMLYILWDLKLKVGQAVRTVDECIRLGRNDLTIRTALLEHRFLVGDDALAEELHKRLWDELFAGTGPEFVEAKLEERAQRHKRAGGSRYLVEPNVKEGKGGLRDLQTLFWIAKYLNRAKTPADLVERGVFTADEMKTFLDAENFLWAARCQLHLVAGRPAEQLTFDFQVEVARRLGFADTAGQRAVERFMQTYFTYARQVGELTRIFLVALEAEHVKKRPGLARNLLSMFNFGSDQAPEGYAIRNGRLDTLDPKLFEKDALNILRLFKAALSTGYLIHPDAMRRVTASLDLIDDRLRADPEANRIFLELLLDPNDPERALRRMNEMGVLGAFLPEFGRIVAMMQFNMYHHYTVDEHTIRCIATLHDVEMGRLKEELPVASGILKRGVNRRALYVALLLHDVGKGQPRDHSELGAEIALEVCPRLGLPADEVDTVAWLVRHHLVMSDFAQKRDLADARTVRDFANIVQSPARLKLLTVLTVCDIRGVGPGVWNNWKAMLLRELYALTLDYLTGDTARQSRPERIEEARAAFAAALPGWSEDAIEAEQARHYASFWLGLTVDTQVIFANLLREVTAEKPAIRIDQDDARDATRACFAMYDHPGLFSRLAGALALAGANVVDARTYTTSDGIATPVFWIQDKEGKPFETARLTRLQRMIERTLAGEVVAREAFAERDRVKKREKAFTVPTEITFDNDGSEIYTMITVDTRDRPGLLYDLSRSLTAAHLQISSAIIATYGEQAVDTFYVKDAFGLKISSKSKQQQVETMLRDAIRRGAERAEG